MVKVKRTLTFLLYHSEEGVLVIATPVAPLYAEFGTRYPESDPELLTWIKENRINPYDPFGGSCGEITYNSYKEFCDAMESGRRYHREQEQIRLEQEQITKKKRLAADATGKLANAVRRGDVKAVEALVEKGAKIDVVISEVGSLQKLAKEKNRVKMVNYLASLAIE